tara:strand:+ start:73 stop:1080 length:1008 start_codon:yes stop_codon:yes gene_type:complete
MFETTVTVKLLTEMIEEMMDHPEVVKLREADTDLAQTGEAGAEASPAAGVEPEKMEQKTRDVILPVFAISKNWGKPDGRDKLMITPFLNAVGGDTFADKINQVNSFVTTCQAQCVGANALPPAQVLGNLVFMETMASLINSYQAGSAGELFESFVAIMMGGEQVGDTNKVIQDAKWIVGGEYQDFSLKLLSPGTPIKGSIKNLTTWRLATEQESMPYIIGVKQQGKIVFYQETIGPEGSGATLSYPPAHKGQFSFKQEELQNKVAELLTPDPQEMRAIALKFAEQLGTAIVETYGLLNDLTKAANKFFVANDTSAGLQAQGIADELAATTKKYQL